MTSRTTISPSPSSAIMATAHYYEGHKPVFRTESLQKMLELEKKCKIARLQNSQDLSRPESTIMPLQPHQRTPMPIQARRRDSRESLNRKLQQQQQQGYKRSEFMRRPGPTSPLSITIPSPMGSVERESQTHAPPSLEVTALAGKDDASQTEKYDDATPRCKPAMVASPSKIDDYAQQDDDEDESDQSSICQSPSWEGYGQKKRDKKKQQAEQKRKEKEKAEQQVRYGMKKKTTNRLFKLPPDNTDSSTRPSTSTSTRPSSSSGLSVTPGRFTPSGSHGMIPEVWGMGMGSGLSTPKPRTSYLKAASVAESVSDQEFSQGSSVQSKRGESVTAGKEKTSYPPTSSRSHTLRNIVFPSHSRSNISSTTTEEHEKEQQCSISEHKTQLYSAANLSDQSLNHSTEFHARGRQSVEPISYVRRARAQSVERSINGFMQQATLSDPNLLNAPNRLAFYSHLGSPPLQQNSCLQAANAGLSHTAQSTEKQIKALSDNTPLKNNSGLVAELKKVQAQENSDSEKQKASIPPSATEMAHAALDKDEGPTSADYFNFAPKPRSTHNPDFTTQSVGILSSIRTRIGRRSSISSGSTSNTGRSFKERAMGTMNTSSSASNTDVAAVSPMSSQMSTRQESQNPSSISAVSSQQAEFTGHSMQISYKETKRLPKAARVLGEINQETMSQGPSTRSRPSGGSSASSCHDDSSSPPSPASTPDTSRPQSAKGLSETIEDIRIGSSMMFLGCHEGLVAVSKVLQTGTTHAFSQINASQETMNVQSYGDLERANNKTADARDPHLDYLQSKERILDSPEPGTGDVQILKSTKQPRRRSHDTERSELAKHCSHSEIPQQDEHVPGSESGTLELKARLYEGLGILDEAWSQSTATLDNDDQSFVTTLTNQKSIASLRSQAVNIKEAALLEDAQGLLQFHPALVKNSTDTAAAVFETRLQDVDDTRTSTDGTAGRLNLLEKPYSRHNFRQRDKKNGLETNHMAVLSEDPRNVEQEHCKRSIDLSDGKVLPHIRHEAVTVLDFNTRNSVLPSAKSNQEAGADAKTTPAVESLTRVAHASSRISASGRQSPSAIYLGEARRSAPNVPSPLANMMHSEANILSPSLSRLHPLSLASLSLSQQQPQIQRTLLSQYPSDTVTKPTNSPTSPQFLIPAHGSEQFGRSLSKPIAKMLVECCSCRFFHDMPSSVYECMVHSDALVTDQNLGISGTITNTVKCHWCSHNMNTRCCAGYAAVVYLKERLH